MVFSERETLNALGKRRFKLIRTTRKYFIKDSNDNPPSYRIPIILILRSYINKSKQLYVTLGKIMIYFLKFTSVFLLCQS